jgi:hypothetical protein
MSLGLQVSSTSCEMKFYRLLRNTVIDPKSQPISTTLPL